MKSTITAREAKNRINNDDDVIPNELRQEEKENNGRNH